MPLPLTVSCFNKIQMGFTYLVPADLGSPGKRAVKRVCVCVCGLEGQVLGLEGQVLGLEGQVLGLEGQVLGLEGQVLGLGLEGLVLVNNTGKKSQNQCVYEVEKGTSVDDEKGN